ncbi:MAG: hypothetical protein GF307_10525 [candidate division Zixibacteria bacterium]|nr:hypothetical protein [candidate division Zixibacteria bacterium]
MNNEHLNDEQLQAYLDDSSDVNHSVIEKHLSVCEKCRNALESYKELYTALAEDSGFDLPESFPEKVMTRFENVPVNPRRELLLDWLIAAVSILAGGAAIFLIFDIRQFLGGIIKISREQAGLLNDIFEGIGFYSHDLSAGGNLIIYAILIIGAIALFDKFLLKGKIMNLIAV